MHWTQGLFKLENSETNGSNHFNDCPGRCSLRASSPIWASEVSLARTRERGAEARASPSQLRRSLARSRETPFARPNRRACSQAKGGALNCTYAITLIIRTASRRYVPHYALHSSSSPRKGASRLTPLFSPVPTTSPNIIAPFPFLRTSGHTISSLSFLYVRHVIHFPSPSLKRFVTHCSFACFKDNIPLKTPRRPPMDWLNGHTQSN